MNRTSNRSTIEPRTMEPGRRNLASYGTGFVLAVILTALAFALVAFGAWPREITIAAAFLLGCLQILAHLHYFLHVDASAAMRWNVWFLLLAVVVIVLIVGGTIWIMYHLAYNLS